MLVQLSITLRILLNELENVYALRQPFKQLVIEADILN
jgi:hypothetical protein